MENLEMKRYDSSSFLFSTAALRLLSHLPLLANLLRSNSATPILLPRLVVSSPSHRMPPPLPRFTAATGGSFLAAVARSPLHYRPEFSTATAVDMTGAQEKQAAPQSQPPASGGGVADSIMPHLLNIYGSCATAQDFEMYAANATFEDPLMRAHGVKQIKSAFYTLPKVFGESKITEYTVQEKPMGPGKTEVLIENKQHYKVLGKPVDLTSLITLQVENGKVVKHTDWWDKKPLKNRETVRVPLVGRLAEGSRRGAMLLTHALMGFGKDPKPTQSPQH